MERAGSLFDADDEVLRRYSTGSPRTPGMCASPRTPTTEPLGPMSTGRHSLLGTPDRPTHGLSYEEGNMSPFKRPPMFDLVSTPKKRGFGGGFGDYYGDETPYCDPGTPVPGSPCRGGFCMTDGEDDATLSDDGYDGVSRYAMDFIERGELGRGSFGVVYKAQHRLDGKFYAVKKSKTPFTGHSRSQENHLQEVYSLAALPRCTHRVTYYDCWIENNCLCIRFEYCEGGNIASIPFDEWTYDEMLEVFYQMAIGLQSLHTRNVVHLDVKAENIFITKQGEKNIYKLGDFGLARKVDTCWVGANDEEGDSRYLCQAFLSAALTSSKKYPKAADIFSLAATVYELARRRPLPKNGNEWQEIRNRPAVDIEDDYDPSFVQLLKDCMDPVPTKRPTCMDILNHSVFEQIKRKSARYSQIKALELRLAQLRRNKGVTDTPGSSSTPGLSDSQSPEQNDVVQRRQVAALDPPYTP